MGNPGERSCPILPDKAVFAQCGFLSEEDSSVGCAIMTTVVTRKRRTEQHYLMIPIDPAFARKIKRVMFVTEKGLVESIIDKESQLCVIDPNVQT